MALNISCKGFFSGYDLPFKTDLATVWMTLKYVFKMIMQYNRGGQSFLLTGQILEKNCIKGRKKILLLI